MNSFYICLMGSKDTKKQLISVIVLLGIIIGLLWYIINPDSFFSFIKGVVWLVLFILFIYVIIKAISSNSTINIIKDNKEKLVSKDLYKYIKNYVRKGFHLSEGEDFERLKELLAKKGVEILDIYLIGIIEEEQKEYEYEQFKDMILEGRPKKLIDYVVIFVDAFGEDEDNFFDYFIRLLEEKKIEINQIELKLEIAKAKKDLELQQFEKKLESDDVETSIEELDLMDGHEFERFLKELFKKMGYKVNHTKLSNDQGADLVVSKFGRKRVVQAKRYNHTVGNKAIQEVVAAIKHYKADEGMVVTTNTFTKPAVQLADSNNIDLVDRYKLKRWLKKYM
jgi:HJR/Mrr/RecB family endonuclease